MARPFLLRVGIAQISSNPAYSDERQAWLQEPIFPKENHPVGLFKLAAIEEINALRQRIEEKYITHLGHKLEALIRFAGERKVELLLFPDYSIPLRCLPLCAKLSQDLSLAIIAGSHVASFSSSAQRAYRDLGLALPEHKGDPGIQQAVCVVFRPRQQALAFARSVNSIWKPCISEADAVSPSFSMESKAGKLEVEMPICPPAAYLSGTAKTKHKHPQLASIATFSRDCDSFTDLGQGNLTQGKSTVIINVAEFGGSRMFSRCDSIQMWFLAKSGTLALPQGSEALLVVLADLETQFHIRKTSQQGTMISELEIYPTLYPLDSAEKKEYVEAIQSLPADPNMESLARTLTPYLALRPDVLPKLLQSKLEHFLNFLLPSGRVAFNEVQRWIRPAIVSDTYSTDVLRWELCNQAIQILNQLQVSGRHASRGAELLQVYSHFMAEHNDLIKLIGSRVSERISSKPLEIEIGQSGITSTFMDRQPAFDRIQSFMNQDTEIVFTLSGMRGIGKTSVVTEAFRQIIPPHWRKIQIQVTEGISYTRFLAQLAFECDLQINERDLSDSTRQNELERRLLSTLSSGPAFVIALDDFHFALNAKGEIEDSGIRALVNGLVLGGGRLRCKYFLISDIQPNLDAEIEKRCSRYVLQGLESDFTERLLRYWFQFQCESPAPRPSDKLLAVLGGHPLATRFAARLWAEHPSADISSDMFLFKQLRDKIVAYILDRVSLTIAESDLMLFASVLRVPAPREVFVRWRGEAANELLNSLTNQYLVESSEHGYQLHPLVREFYNNQLPLPKAMEFHRIVGRFYQEVFEKEKSAKRLVPMFLGEAVHHYLMAADRTRVQGLAFYASELKPVAKSHYHGGDYRAAEKDYLILADLDDRDADAHFHLALIYGRKGDWHEAQYRFEKAESFVFRPFWMYQGFAAIKLGASRFGEAEQLLDVALKWNPTNSASLFTYGRLRERQGRTDDAEGYYRQAIDADPDDFMAYRALARLLYNEHDISGAYEMIKGAVTCNPTDPASKKLLEDIKKTLENPPE